MSHLHHKVSALIDGELAGAARRRAIAHLQSCPDCRRDLQATLDLKRRLTGLRPSEPSADLFSSLDSMPGSSAVAAAEAPPRRAPLRRALAGAGTASLAVMSLAYVVGAPSTTEAAAVVPPVEEANAEFAASAGGYGLSDPAVDALLTTSIGPSASASAGDLAPMAFGIGAATALATMRRGDDAAAIRLLRRAVRAPERVAYRGVRSVHDYTSAGATDIRLAVDHVPDQGTSYRVLGADTPKVALFVNRVRDRGPSAASARVSVLAETYDVSVLAHDDVLGRPATVVGVGDDGQMIASLWIDDATGVLLDRDLYDNGTLVRSSRFESIEIGDDMFLSHPPPEMAEPDGSDLPMRYAGVLGDEGWACPHSVGRGLTLTALGRVGTSGSVVEAVYSDGISSASVFEQRGVLDRSALAGYRQVVVSDAPVYVRNGLPSTWVWQSGDTVYTMLSDAPPAQAAAAVADLPHESTADDSALDRIGVGLSRIGAFLDPAR
jgi:sigma-E factor negative regulatory protein RseB